MTSKPGKPDRPGVRRARYRRRRTPSAAAESTDLTTGLTRELENPQELKIAADIENNRQVMVELLGHSDDLIRRDLMIGGADGIRASVFYYQGMANHNYIHSFVIDPLVVWSRPEFYQPDPKISVDELRERLVVATEITFPDTLGPIVNDLFNGHVAVFVDGLAQAMTIRAAGFKTRNITEPVNETAVRGPAEGFIEDVVTNVTMIRRRLKSPHLVVENMIVGDETRTRLRLIYARNIAPPAIVKEVRRRIKQIKRDKLLDSGTLEYLIVDHPYSLWPAAERTERPEVVVDELLQGRVSIVMDNTPQVIVLPSTARNFFKAPDDVVESFYFATLIRLIRIVAFIISSFLTPVYVALVTFHPAMIPLPLLLSISASQEGVPLPIVVIAFGMEVIIEVVREAGIRLPRTVGSAVSIVGTIVVGQAAITARFAPPGLVVVVAIAAIASFAIPDYGAAISFRLLRFPALLAGSLLGIYGVVTVAILVLFDLCSMKSLGVPFVSLYTPGRVRETLDNFAVVSPRNYSPKRRLSYRDRYRGGRPPRVRSRIPWLETKDQRGGNKRK